MEDIRTIKDNAIHNTRYLTLSEIKLMHDLMSGLSYNKIAEKYGKSVPTVNTNIKNVRDFLLGHKGLSKQRLCILKKQILENVEKESLNKMILDINNNIELEGFNSIILYSSRDRKKYREQDKEEKEEKEAESIKDNTVEYAEQGEIEHSKDEQSESNSTDNNQQEHDIFMPPKAKQKHINIDLIADASKEVDKHTEELNRQKEDYEETINDLRQNERTGIVYGKFDPMTIRDEYIIKEALNIFGKIIVVIENNTKCHYRIQDSIRKSIVQRVYAGDNRVTFADTYKSVQEYMTKNNGYIEIKAIGIKDSIEELVNNHRISKLLNNQYRVVYIPIPSEYDCVTTDIVCKAVDGYSNIDGLVPKQVSSLITNLLKQNR